MYTVAELGVSDSQLQTLLEGNKIVLEKNQFRGNVPLPLTKAQVASLTNAKRSFTLKLSSRQLSYMQQHGEGWFKDRGMEIHQAVDMQMGSGWFKDYLLPGVETAAKIAIPLLRGRGLAASKEMTGEGIFSNIIRGVAGLFGGGWTPMDKKKPHSGRGLVL